MNCYKCYFMNGNGGKNMEGNKIQEVFDELYENVLKNQDRLENLLTSMKKEQLELNEREEEQLTRILFSMQVARDILENKVTPGKHLTFNYPEGTLTMHSRKEK
jgi:transcription elongation GreA/GreB family factor